MHMRVSQDTLRYLVIASMIVHPVTGHWPLLVILSMVTIPGTGYLGLDETGSQPHLKKHFQRQVGKGNWHTRLKGKKMQTLPHLFLISPIPSLSPIIALPCQSLTHWLTHWSCWNLIGVLPKRCLHCNCSWCLYQGKDWQKVSCNIQKFLCSIFLDLSP